MAPQEDALKTIFTKAVKEAEPFPSRDADLATLAAFGRPGHIRPNQYWFIDVMKKSLENLERVFTHPERLFYWKEFMDAFPARQLVMDFPPSYFEDICKVFLASDIALAFNSFDPINGIEVVHLNEKAQSKEFVDRRPGDKKRSGLRERTLYKDIKPEYVRDGLWLYQYGLEDNSQVDGAYYRQVMLDELMPATDVFVARPISYKWIGKLPTCWTEMEDLKYEVFFNGSYQGERDKIFLINYLIRNKLLKEEESHGRYHQVNLHETEMETQQGFFDIVFESVDVFDRARKNAKETFSKFLSRPGHGG